MKRAKFNSEADLAGVVSAWLTTDGWTCYHEVPVASGRIDILAVRGPLVWAVETKLRAGLEVVDQALSRARGRQVHGAVVAVQYTLDNCMALINVCSRLGLGVITTSPGRSPDLRVWPEFRRHAKPATLLAELAPEQRLQAAGKGGSTYWTPFKTAVREFIYAQAAVAGGRRTVVLAAAETCVGVYKPHHEAPQLRRWLVWAIERGLIPGCRCEGAGKAREVVFDAGLVTAVQIREYQLDRARLLPSGP